MDDPRDPSELELQKTDPSPAAAPAMPPSRAPWIVGAVLLVAAMVAGYFLFLARPAPEPALVETPAPAVEPAPAPEPLGAAAKPIEVPPLGESDPLVRQLVRALSSHPRVTAWLATDDLIRNFTVTVENIAQGQTPATHLRTLRPAESFRVAEGEDELLVDPRSYERYTQIAAAVDSVDPQEAARLYSTLKPRIEEAYRDLGHTGSFDRALEQAIVVLLRTPVIEGTERLEPRGGLYVYQNPALERLSHAQKQFARMGPRNVRVIQSNLRNIAIALGIAPERLP